MKKTIFLAALSSLIALSAHATKGAPYVAPKAEKAGFNWTGFYLGINGGYGWGQENFDYTAGYIPGDPTTEYETIYAGSTAATDASPSFNGWLAGGQVGYNYAVKEVGVIGLEADIQGSGFGSDYTGSPGYIFTAESNMNWFGTVRGKMGLFWGDVLFYATGGLAYGGQEVTADKFPVAGVNASGSDSEMRIGWAAGAGIEGVIYGQLTAKLEYLYLGFDEETYDLGELPAFDGEILPQTATADNHVNTLRLGLNYHF